jgi:hypothetical protein
METLLLLSAMFIIACVVFKAVSVVIDWLIAVLIRVIVVSSIVYIGYCWMYLL